jgi:hypothetical protein
MMMQDMKYEFLWTSFTLTLTLLKHHVLVFPGRSSSVDIATLRAGRSGNRIWVGARYSAPVQTALEPTQPPIQWVLGLSRE